MSSSQVFVKSEEIPTKSEVVEILNDLNLHKEIRNAKQIVIKVNLCAGDRYNAESGVVSNLKVLIHLIGSLRYLNEDALIFIAESDSSGGCFACDKFKFQEMLPLAESFSRVKLLDLSHSRLHKYPYPKGLYFQKGIVLSEVFCEKPFIISLAKMKTHFITGVTGCMKNMFGCLADTRKHFYHPYIDQVIVDIVDFLRPGLCIVEGFPAMEGLGPEIGDRRDANLILLGNNPVAVDAVMCKVMGVDPQTIPHIRLASDCGIGPSEINHIGLMGDSLPVLDTFELVSREQRLFVDAGLWIQRLGQTVAQWGHLIHNIHSTQMLKFRVKRKLNKMLTRHPSPPSKQIR